MQRLLILLFACLIVLLNPVAAGTAQAQTSTAVSPPSPSLELTKEQAELFEQQKTQLLSQLESILTPEQYNQLETAMAEGKTSLRKAFKSAMLTPNQKSKLATVFKSLPQKDFFTSLTPEQKKQLFLKKKDLFIPTADEINEFKTLK